MKFLIKYAAGTAIAVLFWGLVAYVTLAIRAIEPGNMRFWPVDIAFSCFSVCVCLGAVFITVWVIRAFSEDEDANP